MKPRIHYGNIDITSDLFTTIENTQVFLEKFCKQTERICQKENSNILMIGIISHCDKNSIKTLPSGKRIATTSTENIHIHITYLSEKFSTIEKKLRAYLAKQSQLEPFISRITKNAYLENRIPYIMTQCLKFRTANTCTDDFVKRYCGNFISKLEKANTAIGNKKLIFPQYNTFIFSLDRDNSLFEFAHKDVA